MIQILSFSLGVVCWLYYLQAFKYQTSFQHWHFSGKHK